MSQFVDHPRIPKFNRILNVTLFPGSWNRLEICHLITHLAQRRHASSSSLPEAIHLSGAHASQNKLAADARIQGALCLLVALASARHLPLTTLSTADNPARTTKLFCCPMPPGCSAVCCELQCERRVLRQRRDRRLSETMSVRAKRRHCQLPRYLQHIHQALTCTQPLRLPLLRILSRLLPACRFQAAATSCSSTPRLPRATATALLQVCNPTMSQMPRCDTASYCARLPCSCSPTPIHGAACCLLSAACRALLPSTPSSAPPCVRDIACSRPSLPQKSMQQASARAACVV